MGKLKQTTTEVQHLLDYVEELEKGSSNFNIEVDAEFSEASKNPVQNKVVTAAYKGIDSRVTTIENFFDMGAKLNLFINSNQNNDAAISAVKALISYSGNTFEMGSGTVGLPVFTDVTITFPDVEGYRTPQPIVFTTGAVPISYTATYETEVIDVVLSAWDGASMLGQIITIDGQSYTWDGTAITRKMPYGKEYELFAAYADGYISPSVKHIASQPNRSINLMYGAMVGTWITIDQTITDPASMISGDINGEHIQLIRNNSHRYVGKYTEEGTMTICQLDDTNSNYYSDGAKAVLTGADGDVFMRLPRFFYYALEAREDVWKVGFYYGNEAPAQNWREWDGKELVGVYPLTTEGKSYSGSQKYQSSTMKVNLQLAAERGEGYSLIQLKHHNIISFLSYAKYGTTNIDAIVGTGKNYDISYSQPQFHSFGATDAKGMEDTTTDTSAESNTNIWGLESWNGQVMQEFCGIYGEVRQQDGNEKRLGLYYDDGKDGILINTYKQTAGTYQYGYLMKAIIGPDLEALPLELSAQGSSSTGYCGYMSFYQQSNGKVVLMKSSSFMALTITTMRMEDNTTYYNSRCSRLAFCGDIKIENNSTAFKSLTAIN